MGAGDASWTCPAHFWQLWSHWHPQQGLKASAPRPPVQPLHHQAQDGVAHAGTKQPQSSSHSLAALYTSAMSSLSLDVPSGISVSPAWSCWGCFNSLASQKSPTATRNWNFTGCLPTSPPLRKPAGLPSSASKAEPCVALGSLPPRVAALESAAADAQLFLVDQGGSVAPCLCFHFCCHRVLQLSLSFLHKSPLLVYHHPRSMLSSYFCNIEKKAFPENAKMYSNVTKAGW